MKKKKEKMLSNKVKLNHLMKIKAYKMNRIICPRKAFRIDFTQFLESLIQQKYSLIICINSNKNIRSERIAKLFTKLGLIELSQ